jgi:hypothetical protein
VGWWKTDEKATEIALSNSLFSVVAIENDKIIGLGRIVMPKVICWQPYCGKTASRQGFAISVYLWMIKVLHIVYTD